MYKEFHVLSTNSYESISESTQLEQFVLEHRSLVRKIALHIKRKLPSHIELDDLLQSGLVGLLEARTNYDITKGASFDTYAATRIKGAIVDALRKTSWVSRDTFKNMKKMSEAIDKIEQRNQKAATTKEIAAEMDLSVNEYFKISQDINVCSILSLDILKNEQDIHPDLDKVDDPQSIIQFESIKSDLKDILKDLPEREQLILSLYYIEELTFKQIAETLELTEARICQLHTQAIARIRVRMKLA